jgi:hypothetical protein
MPVASFGTDLTLKGDQIKPTKRPIVGPPVFVAPVTTVDKGALVLTTISKSLQQQHHHQQHQTTQPHSQSQSQSQSQSHSLSQQSKQNNPKPPPPYFPRASVSTKRNFGIATALSSSEQTDQTSKNKALLEKQALLYNDSDDELSVSNENRALQSQMPPHAPTTTNPSKRFVETLEKREVEVQKRPLSQDKEKKNLLPAPVGKQVVPVKIFNPF